MNYSNRIGKTNGHSSSSPASIDRLFFSVRITTSVYPVPAICRFDQLGDWFESLADILHWNLRKSQSGLTTDSSSAHHNQPSPSNETKDSSISSLSTDTPQLS